MLRMLGTNALAAFAQAISRNPAQPVRGLAGPAEAQAPQAANPAQRKLEAVPPAPSRPLPRGSLLDLRV